jgi:hypothetical protein
LFLRDDGQREFLDVDTLVRHVISPGSVFEFLAADRQLFIASAIIDL